MTQWQALPWPDWIQRPVRVFDSIDSTNSLAMRLAVRERVPEGTLVIAENQTAGRGRMQRKWYSLPGGSLYVSLVLRPDLPASCAHVPTLLAASSVAAAVAHLYRLPARVKWPNDVMVEGRKLGGILTESVLKNGRIDSLVVGLGVNCNLNLEALPEDLRVSAVSLSSLLGREIERGQLLLRVLDIFHRDYRLCLDGDVEKSIRGWRALNASIGSTMSVTTPEGVIEGIAERLLDDGTLVLREQSTQRLLEIRAGEIK